MIQCIVLLILCSCFGAPELSSSFERLPHFGEAESNSQRTCNKLTVCVAWYCVSMCGFCSIAALCCRCFGTRCSSALVIVDIINAGSTLTHTVPRVP